jgi:WD40 repeat protein
MIALAAVIFTSVSVGIVLVTLLKLEADRQAEIARQNAFEADRQAGIATQNATEAVRQTGIAQEKERLAISARLEADARRSEAEYEAYVALIGLAAAKIEENALSQAQAALAACEPRLRGWEWRRLQYVVQQGRGRELDVGARIECLAVSNDDQRVATGSRDGAVRVWDVDGERVIHELLLRGANVYVSAIAFSPDGKQIAVGSNSPEGFLRIWDLTTGEARPLTDPQGHTATVLHVAFSRDGSKLLTASRDATARLWDVASGRPLVSYRGHSRFVWSAVFSPDETYIATASEDGTVRLWRTETGQELTDAREGRRLPFTGHRGPVYAVAFLPGDPGEKAAQIPGVGYVASAGYDKRILMWKPSDLAPFDFRKLLANETVATTPALELTGHAAAVRDLRLSPDGKRLLSASADHTLRTWYAIEEDAGYAIVKRGALDKELRGHDGPVQAAGFWRASPDAIVSAGYDGKVRFWRVGAYHEERPIPGRVLRGHLDAVMAARFSHDGQSIVTASPDRTAKKWSVADGAEQITFREGHAYLASKAFFFPDRQRLMTAAVDGAVRIWSLDKGAELLKLEGTGYRSAAALSADGQWILTGSDQSIPVTRVEGRTFAGQAAILWNASTGEKVHVLPGHKAPVTVVAFSADGEVAFSGDDNGVGVLWERESGRQLSRLEFHLGAVVGAVFAPDGKSLFTASADRTVCEWDLSDPHRVLAKTSLALQHPKAVTSLAMAGDGRRLLTGCDDGQVRLWDLATRKVAWVGETQAVDGDQLPGDVNAVAVSPDGRLALAVDSVDQIVRLFDMETGREILGTSPEGEVDHFLRLRRFEAMGWSADFAPDGQSIITVGGDEARLWDMQGVQLAAYGPHRPIIFADYSPDDVFVITAGWDQTARIWNSATGQPVLTLSAHSAGEHGGHAGAINTAVYSPDGALVLTASEDGTVRLWDVATMRVLRIYRGHTAGVTRAFFTMDAGSMITASRDGTAALWRIDDEAPLRTFAGHTGAVLDVQVSEDGKFLVTGGADNTARIWRMETGAELLKLEGHSGEVAAVAIYAGDKLRVLTGSADQTAKLWDVETPLAKEGAATGAAKELLTLRGHTRGITSVQFSPDGRAALTASRDGVAILWPTMEATDP